MTDIASLKTGDYYIASDECIGCRSCLKVCPQGCIDFRNISGKIQQDSCVRCGACGKACPVNAVKRK